MAQHISLCYVKCFKITNFKRSASCQQYRIIPFRCAFDICLTFWYRVDYGSCILVRLILTTLHAMLIRLWIGELSAKNVQNALKYVPLSFFFHWDIKRSEYEHTATLARSWTQLINYETLVTKAICVCQKCRSSFVMRIIVKKKWIFVSVFPIIVLLMALLFGKVHKIWLL